MALVCRLIVLRYLHSCTCCKKKNDFNFQKYETDLCIRNKIARAVWLVINARDQIKFENTFHKNPFQWKVFHEKIIIHT